MINTVQIKQQQLTKGFFTVGSGSEVILVMGSCRVCNIVTYFDEWNKQNGNRFTIHSLDPFNFNWDVNDDRVDYVGAINSMETNQDMLAMLKSVDYFVHEYYQNFGMFNCSKNSEKTIYQFGMNPEVDICIPSWNDVFVLFSDIIAFNIDMRKKAAQDFNTMGKLSYQTELELFKISQENLEKFYDVCEMSDIPEMAEYFEKNFKEKRLWWSYNHTSKYFTIRLFLSIVTKMGMYLPAEFVASLIEMEDIFANNYTVLTDYDLKWYEYKWKEETVTLKSKVF